MEGRPYLCGMISVLSISIAILARRQNITTLFVRFQSLAGKAKLFEGHYFRRGSCSRISCSQKPSHTRKKYEIATDEEFTPIKQDIKKGQLREFKKGDIYFNYGW